MIIIIVDYSSLMSDIMVLEIADCIKFKKVNFGNLKRSGSSENFLSALFMKDILTKNIPKLISSINDAIIIKTKYSRNKLIQYLISEGEESINDIIKKAYELQDEYDSLTCDLEIDPKDLLSKDALEVICSKIKKLIKEKLK